MSQWPPSSYGQLINSKPTNVSGVESKPRVPPQSNTMVLLSLAYVGLSDRDTEFRPPAKGPFTVPFSAVSSYEAMCETAKNLFGSHYAFSGSMTDGHVRPRVFVKLPNNRNLPPASEAPPEYFAANISAYCTDQILFIGKVPNSGGEVCDDYCVFGEIDGRQPGLIWDSLPIS